MHHGPLSRPVFRQRVALTLAVLLHAVCLRAFVFEAVEGTCEKGPFPQQLLRGDFSLINRAFEERNIHCLWHFFLQAAAKTYGRGQTDEQEAEFRQILPEEKRLEMNREVRKLAASYLKELPDHAEYVDSWIDKTYKAQQNPTRDNFLLYTKRVDYFFEVLVSLGSPECVETLMSHLDDERVLGQGKYGGPNDPLPPENWICLMHVLAWAKSNKREPWMQFDLGYGGGTQVMEARRRMLRAWWASAESDAYKVKTPRAGVKSAGSGTRRDRMAAPQGEDRGLDFSAWLMIALCAGGLVAATLLAARKRRR